MATRAKIICEGGGGGEDFLRTNQFAQCYTVYYFRKTRCYGLICEHLGSSGTVSHFHSWCNPKKVALLLTLWHRRSGGSSWDSGFLLLKEQDGDDEYDDKDHRQHGAHNPQHFRLLLLQALADLDWVRVGAGWECHLQEIRKENKRKCIRGKSL